MGPVAIVLAVAATAMSAVSAISAGQAQASAARTNAAIARQNAKITMQQAQQQAEAQQRDARKKIGAIRAAYGASGVSIEGSPLDVLEESAVTAELDRQTIIYNGRIKAAGYTNTAMMEERSASAAITSSYLQAGSAILSGASSVVGMMPSSTPSSVSKVGGVVGDPK